MCKSSLQNYGSSAFPLSSLTSTGTTLSRFRSRGLEPQRFLSSMSSGSSKRAAISSLLTTKSDEHEPGCVVFKSDIEFAANSLMMFANAGDGSLVLSNPQELATIEEEPINSIKLERRKKRVRTKKLLDVHFDSCADQDMKYRCKTCTRKFSSFQALGGHRTSCNNKFKSSYDGSNNMHEEIEDDLNEEIINYEDDLRTFKRFSSLEDRRSLQIEMSNAGWGNRAKPGHECSVCYRVFSSGQALGGHKRCHSVPPVAVPVGLDNSPCLSTIEEHHQPVKAHGLLDLNLPPPLEEEDYWIENDESVLPGDRKWRSLTISI